MRARGGGGGEGFSAPAAHLSKRLRVEESFEHVGLFSVQALRRHLILSRRGKKIKRFAIPNPQKKKHTQRDGSKSFAFKGQFVSKYTSIHRRYVKKERKRENICCETRKTPHDINHTTSLEGGSGSGCPRHKTRAPSIKALSLTHPHSRDALVSLVLLLLGAVLSLRGRDVLRLYFLDVVLVGFS